jgi:hypothetical protein
MFPATALKLVALVWLSWTGLQAQAVLHNTSQDRFPEPPNDATRVYYAQSNGQLLALPFESAELPLNIFVPAKRDAVLRVVLKGAAAETTLETNEPVFYVFVGDKMDPPPHQLVRLKRKGMTRELAVSVIKGRKGYAPFEDDNIKLQYRLVERLRLEASKGRYLFVNYLQLRPARFLAPGEYSIIGDSLADMATFRVR